MAHTNQRANSATDINQTRIVVTFGSNHTHPVSGRSLGNNYVVVTGPDYESCRAKVIRQFGSRWAFDYIDWVHERSAEEQAGVDQYKLIEVDFATGERIR